MAEMLDVASHFDTDPVVNAYTSAFAFFGQSTTFNEASPDGSVNKRRTLSVRPSITIPSRRAISIYGDIWIVGDSNVDGFSSSPIRRTHWLKKATQLAVIQTPGQLLSAAAGTPTYVNTEYLKDTVNPLSNSEYDTFWEVFISQDESVSKGMYIKWGSYVNRVRNTHLDIAGFNNAQCDELDSGAIVTATTTVGGTYDPVSEATTGGGPTNYPAILLDAYKIYRYDTQADKKVDAGDMFLVVQSTTPSNVGGIFTIAGEKWRVLNQYTELDALSLHIRRA